jgi:calcineurin-like phosphoesterase family protein
MNIFWTADTHFRHNNIRKYCNRPFATCEEMDEAMTANWNAVVKPGDVVYHLGDFAFTRSAAETEAILKRLNGNIHLIQGNHDKDNVRKAKGFAWVSDKHQGKMVKFGEQLVFMSHYAMRVWDRSHHGAWCLHGHSHGTLPDDPNMLSMDVGVDANNFTPVSFEQVMDIMSKKNFKPVDHHGEEKEDG